ncbi:MAG: hypothetical protein FWD23_01275 [Oscillospiraceae bacterium]|nr:hypothetical protein [Oscillospiraceae bacterium]
MGKFPKTAKAGNIILSFAINVRTPMVNGILPAGSEINNVRIIAGDGTSTKFRDAEEYVFDFGGDKEKWQKKGGIIYTDNFTYDVHWCEYKGAQYDHKLKGVKVK